MGGEEVEVECVMVGTVCVRWVDCVCGGVRLNWTKHRAQSLDASADHERIS